MTAASFTKATGMGPLPRTLESANGARAVERVFNAEGLPLWLAHDQGSHIPLRSMMGLFERAAREMGADLFGLHVGLAMQPEDYGPVVRYMMSAPDLRTMIRRSVRSLHYHASGCYFSLEFSGRLARWGIRTDDPSSYGLRQHRDHLLHPMLRALRRYLGSKWSPIQIEVEYDRPPNWRMVEREIGAPIVFGANANAILFEARLLGCHALQQIPVKEIFTWSDLRQIVMHRPPRTTVEAAREIIRLRLFDSNVDIDGAAKLLGIAARTLQRQLAEENLSYRDLVQELRMQRALDLLRESWEPITSIAFSLGYSDVASFSRAFRQWAGTPPSHHRRTLSPRP